MMRKTGNSRACPRPPPSFRKSSEFPRPLLPWPDGLHKFVIFSVSMHSYACMRKPLRCICQRLRFPVFHACASSHASVRKRLRSLATPIVSLRKSSHDFRLIAFQSFCETSVASCFSFTACVRLGIRIYFSMSMFASMYADAFCAQASFQYSRFRPEA